MRQLLATGLVCLFVGVSACEEGPTEPRASTDSEARAQISDLHGLASSASMLNSSAPFRVWTQGFDHGTDGWYGQETSGELGWCGTVEQVTRPSGDVPPSAGRGYAAVSQGGCNAHWSGEFGPLVGAPWAPGPQFSALFQPFPEGGYVVELDVYLDPSYEAVGPAEGTYVFEFPTWKGAVVGYSVSFGTLSNGSFHYLWMPVWEGDGELLVDIHPVTEAGWYTFRFVFQDHDGELAVDFELADRTGQTLFRKSMTSTFYGGTPVSDFATSNVATGYAWFTSISPGLELPIDEYRVRRGG